MIRKIRRRVRRGGLGKNSEELNGWEREDFDLTGKVSPCSWSPLMGPACSLKACLGEVLQGGKISRLKPT